MTLAEVQVKWSVILMDRLGPDIFSTLRMKGHGLHRARAHIKVPGWSLVWNALLTKKLPTFLSRLNEINWGWEKFKCHPSNPPAALHKLIAPSSGVHNYNTRYASKENLYRPVSRPNYGLSRFTSMASRVWEKVPYSLKILPFSSFIQKYKRYLLANQM